MADGGPARKEELALRDGRTFEREYRPIELPDGDGHLWVSQEITEQKEQTERLRALAERSQDLMTADTRERIAELGIEAASDILGLDANSIHLSDEERSSLVPVATTDAVRDLVGDPPVFTGGDSIAWRVYERGEALAVADIRNEPEVYNPESLIRSELYLPLGEHGLLMAGSPASDSFDHQDLALGKTLAGNIASALEQVAQTEQLHARERQLTRQNERLEEFSSIVSHDLRNPLSVAEGNLELVREDCENESLDAIERAHDRMDTLIDDLLAVARKGEAVADTEPVDLAMVIDECWRNVATANASLDTDIDRVVDADGNRLKQVFENLFRNAVEHGGTNVTVSVGALDDGFYVEDDGPGIPSDERTDVFDAGYSTSEGGTGFGLSIVRQVVEAHDWRLCITDGSTGGARFELTGVELTPNEPL